MGACCHRRIRSFEEHYLPFGRSALRTSERNRYRFIGVERDVDTGLCMTGPRTYDPLLGQFLQPDPLVQPGEGPFVYASGNPVGRLDPGGYADTAARPGILKKEDIDASVESGMKAVRGAQAVTAGVASLATLQGDVSALAQGALAGLQHAGADAADLLDSASSDVGPSGSPIGPEIRAAGDQQLGRALQEGTGEAALGYMGGYAAGSALLGLGIGRLFGSLPRAPRGASRSGFSGTARGQVTGDAGIIRRKMAQAAAGDLPAAAELRVAKLLRGEGRSVHMIDDMLTPGMTNDALVDGVRVDVKRIGGLGKNAASNLAKGVRQVGPGGEVIVVRPEAARQSLAQYQDFVGGFNPSQPGVSFRVVNEASLPPLHF